jgi:hypothetical protein
MKKQLFFTAVILLMATFSYAQTPDVKEAEFTKAELTKIQSILKDADPSTYNLTVESSGKATRLGSASMRGLSTVSAYHKLGNGTKASNEIVTTVSDYVKTVWTSAFAQKYPDKVKQINSMMEVAAKRAGSDVLVSPKISKATFQNDELVKIQTILKDADPSMYNLSVEQDGKATRLGSASIRSLSTVSAFHKAGNGTKASNEIVTTVSDYVKTVWTSAFANKYPEKVKAINQIMDAAARR